jgi:hypothetical protein
VNLTEALNYFLLPAWSDHGRAAVHHRPIADVPLAVNCSATAESCCSLSASLVQWTIQSLCCAGHRSPDRAAGPDRFCLPMVLVTMPARMDMGSCFRAAKALRTARWHRLGDRILMCMHAGAGNMHALTNHPNDLPCAL